MSLTKTKKSRTAASRATGAADAARSRAQEPQRGDSRAQDAADLARARAQDAAAVAVSRAQDAADLARAGPATPPRRSCRRHGTPRLRLRLRSYP